jgi:hypothetical protein
MVETDQFTKMILGYSSQGRRFFMESYKQCNT